VNKLKGPERGFCVISWPSLANWFKVEHVTSETESVRCGVGFVFTDLVETYTAFYLISLSPQLPFEMSSSRLICFGLLFLLAFGHVTSQRTSLDVALKNVYRPLRLLGLAFTGRSGDDPQNVQRLQIAGVSPADNNATIDPDLVPILSDWLIVGVKNAIEMRSVYCYFNLIGRQRFRWQKCPTKCTNYTHTFLLKI